MTSPKSLMLWLQPRVGYSEFSKSLQISPKRKLRPLYGNSANQDNEIRTRQMSSQKGAVGSSDAPIYLYGSGSMARRVRSADIVGIMRRDERIAGYADVQGVIDCHKQIIAIQIRNTDHQNNVHGGFIHVHNPKLKREYYLPAKTLHVHLTHLRFMDRPTLHQDQLVRNTQQLTQLHGQGQSPVPSTPTRTHPTTTTTSNNREDLNRFIRHHLSSRSSTAASSNMDIHSRSEHKYSASPDHPQPKYSFTSPLVQKHDATEGIAFWHRRACEIAEENRFKDAVMER